MSVFQHPFQGAILIGEPCSHGVTFDSVAARGLPAAEVQKRWPRGWFTKEKPCPLGCDFNGIAYASYEHYIAGDW